jgi:hypothetical protein
MKPPSYYKMSKSWSEGLVCAVTELRVHYKRRFSLSLFSAGLLLSQKGLLFGSEFFF